jgi:hypothetical protein
MQLSTNEIVKRVNKSNNTIGTYNILLGLRNKVTNRLSVSYEIGLESLLLAPVSRLSLNIGF